MTYAEIITKVADSTGLSRTMVDKTYKAYWRAVREHITTLSLKDGMSDEEFLKAKPNVNIPSIGKLYVPLDRYHRQMIKGEQIRINKERYGTTHQEN